MINRFKAQSIISFFKAVLCALAVQAPLAGHRV